MQKIQAMILDGTIAAGERLPAERQLAGRLGISRASLREALSIMETMGLVHIEPGRGAFVTAEQVDDDAAGGRPPWRFGGRYTLQEVFQVRLLTEGYAARLAAMVVTDEDIAVLQSLLGTHKDAARRLDLVACAQADFDLHLRIMQLGRNRILSDLHETYRSVFTESQRLPLARRTRIWEPIDEHEKVVRALVHRDPDGAEYYMRLHITRAAERVGIALGDTPLHADASLAGASFKE